MSSANNLVIISTTGSGPPGGQSSTAPVVGAAGTAAAVSTSGLNPVWEQQLQSLFQLSAIEIRDDFEEVR